MHHVHSGLAVDLCLLRTAANLDRLPCISLQLVRFAGTDFSSQSYRDGLQRLQPTSLCQHLLTNSGQGPISLHHGADRIKFTSIRQVLA